MTQAESTSIIEIKKRGMDMIECIRVKTEDDLRKCMEIRRTVFIQEQNVPEAEEIDDHDQLDDPIADHFLFLKNGVPVGTVRCLKKGGGVLKVGRVAVLREARGGGIGKEMMDLTEKRYPDIDRFALDAQEHAIPFYEKCGYVASGDVFLDAGIRHRHMEKRNHVV